MTSFFDVFDTAPLEKLFVTKHIALPRITPQPKDLNKFFEWMKENWWMADYTVHVDDVAQARVLALELDRILRYDSSSSEIEPVLVELRKLRYEPGSMPLDRWTSNAYQLVNFAGDPHAVEAITNAVSVYSGTILEAMCGHYSYFPNKIGRTVIALDYCKESLKRYPYPDRRRICFDLNQITRRTQMDFSKDTFDVISVCFGFRYPIWIGRVLREFLRILKPGGILSFVENPGYGYHDLCKRQSDPDKMTRIIMRSGFKDVSCTILETPYDNLRQARFHHIEAKK